MRKRLPLRVSCDRPCSDSVASSRDAQCRPPRCSLSAAGMYHASNSFATMVALFTTQRKRRLVFGEAPVLDCAGKVSGVIIAGRLALRLPVGKEKVLDAANRAGAFPGAKRGIGAWDQGRAGTAVWGILC